MAQWEWERVPRVPSAIGVGALGIWRESARPHGTWGREVTKGLLKVGGGQGFKGTPPGLGGYGGKAGGKGGKGYKGGAKGKGGGKGYQGYCFACGLQGHNKGEPACWFHQGPAPMQMDAVESGGAPTEFGGGSWELAQVRVVPEEAKRSGDRLCDPPDEQQCETSRMEDGRSVLGDWVVVNKKWKKNHRMNKTKEEFKVVEMKSDSMVVEVTETFLGAVGIQEEGLLNMNFQVAGVKKALAAVSRICKAGNVVQFGEDPADCYIQSKKTKKKVMMQQKRGSYVIRVEFVKSVAGEDGERSMKKMGS